MQLKDLKLLETFWAFVMFEGKQLMSAAFTLLRCDPKIIAISLFTFEEPRTCSINDPSLQNPMKCYQLQRLVNVPQNWKQGNSSPYFP